MNLLSVRRYEEALTAYEQESAIFRETGEGSAWAGLGAALAELERVDESIAARQQAVAAYYDVGNLSGEARTSGELGSDLHLGAARSVSLMVVNSRTDLTPVAAELGGPATSPASPTESTPHPEHDAGPRTSALCAQPPHDRPNITSRVASLGFASRARCMKRGRRVPAGRVKAGP
ncbi:hypothetical protein ACFRFL_27400 [Streptomyces sp. NPDC056708]|uniref:hypothetical protein n=1 Tax=unclassified Streptomyces TaxID=2593676 RepID=UPI0036B2339B